jgi:hypothetical protein
MLEGYAKLMDNSAQKMQETDTSIASSISSFG